MGYENLRELFILFPLLSPLASLYGFCAVPGLGGLCLILKLK